MKKQFLILIFALFFVPNFLFAATTRIEGDLNVGSDQKFTDNTYFFASKNTISGEYEKDLFLGSVENRFDGIAKSDLFVFGVNSFISGKVEGDLRVVSGNVFVDAEVVGDLVVFGGNVYLESNSNISGDTILIGGKIYQNSELKSTSKIIGASVYLNNIVSSPIEITAQKITAKPSTKINSPITYYSPNQIIRETGSELNNIVNYNQISNIKDTSFVKRGLINVLNFWILLKFITTLFIALVLVFVFKLFTQKIVDFGLNSFWKNALWGLLLTALTPLILTIFILSLVGLPIGFLLLIIYILFFAVSVSISAIFVGMLAYKLFSKEENVRVNFKIASLGVIIMTLIGFVPVVGDITKIIFNFSAFGALVISIKNLILKR